MGCDGEARGTLGSAASEAGPECEAVSLHGDFKTESSSLAGSDV